jgi:predicted RNA binding protein YcfA (HicA-like mRNA interferase family)
VRLPRNVGFEELCAGLQRHGYEVTRQTGSHLRLTTQRGGEHRVTIPRHKPLRVGTLRSILTDVSEHLGISRDALMVELFGS